jgi:hypothetical protein
MAKLTDILENREKIKNSGLRFHHRAAFFFRHYLEVHNLGAKILCDLFEFGFPEMDGFNLGVCRSLSYHGNNPKARLVYPCADFLSFSYIDLHAHGFHNLGPFPWMGGL